MDMARSRVRLPCLAFNRGKYSDAPVLFNLSERKAVASDMDELRGNTTWPTATPHGWFLVRRPILPSSGTPAMATRSGGRCCRLHLPALRQDCVVLLLDKMDPVLWYCHVGSGGGWERHEYDIGTQILYPDETLHEKLVIASCRGNLYFSTGSFEELGVIEFRRATTPEFSSVAMRAAGEVVYGVAQSKGRLHLLFEGSFSNVVYEVDGFRHAAMVHDLDGQAFLLSAASFGASRPAGECGLEEDCVYVAYPWDRGLMAYNIKEGTIKVEAPESGTPMWMLPAVN
ncbi:unnamed protein product [Urochloa decumbens]|uniref:KIB1-4 beta-propeller domain-containing protein n=1 Tax=Urochloa decumbens TaxID=240449 RepID=A0ABC9F8F9_9POAL